MGIGAAGHDIVVIGASAGGLQALTNALVPEGPGAHHVRGDPTRLRQAFWNLVRNAFQHTPAGGRVTVATATGLSGTLEVTIEDTGDGIDPGDFERIFVPFQQGAAPGMGPAGLGLAICRSVIEAHGGRVSVSSAGRGRGARFVVTLETRAAAAGPPAAVPAVRAPAPSRRSILLVEDHADTASALAQALALQGYHVTVAGSLATARERLREAPDLLISDLALPDGSGLDLIREAGTAAPPHAIALTGFGTDKDVRLAREAGFEAHLIKPVELETLLETIRELERRHEPRPARVRGRNAG